MSLTPRKVEEKEDAMRYVIETALGIALLLTSACVCAPGTNAGVILVDEFHETGIPGIIISDPQEIRAWKSMIDRQLAFYFDAETAATLTRVPVILKSDKSFDPNETRYPHGQYDPVKDTITFLVQGITQEVIVHEYLHRVWDKMLTPDARDAFARDSTAIRERHDNPETERFQVWLATTMITRVNWNKTNAETLRTEEYAFIGSRLALETKEAVPFQLRWHYPNLKGDLTGIYRASTSPTDPTLSDTPDSPK